MKPQVTPPELATLRRHWSQWTALVALHARQRRGAWVVDPQEYQALHRELLVACRALGGAAGARREFYLRLEELARPWLTSQALEQADRELLLGLLARCQQVEKELQRSSGLGADLRWAVAVVALSGAVAVGILLVWNAGWAWAPAQEWLRGWWQKLVLMARDTGEAWWWFVAGVLVALGAIVVAWRSGRSFTGR
jgi:hypothetical protein